MTARINEEAMAAEYQEAGVPEATAREMAKDLNQAVKYTGVWDSMLESIFGLDQGLAR